MPRLKKEPQDQTPNYPIHSDDAEREQENDWKHTGNPTYAGSSFPGVYDTTGHRLQRKDGLGAYEKDRK